MSLISMKQFGNDFGFRISDCGLKNPDRQSAIRLRRPRLGRPTGFTLVEMLIASLVFTIAIVSLMSMVLFALAARYSSRIDSAALRLSQQKLEELKAVVDVENAGEMTPQEIKDVIEKN